MGKELDCAGKLKVLSDRTRLAVMEALLKQPCAVGQLSELLLVEQSLLSHHLRILREAGLVQGDRRGKSVIYRATEATLVPGSTKAINLGCCQLRFEPGQDRRSAIRPASKDTGGAA